ncbi:uncharacterized protein LOC128214295 [Mya arenaria]|uniref:uncharacterized protein LOC128214295 n=1 Tax=Mya arenaria TaxID=6604 RepID=UPI0022E75C03|nr:uncharacterized protein LOC128214295 [Mya arenaria]
MMSLLSLAVIICTTFHATLELKADVQMSFRHLTMRNSFPLGGFQNLHSEFGTREKRATKGCETNAIGNRLSSCVSIAPDMNISILAMMSSACGDVDCYIKCFLEAVGDCYQTGQNFHLDPSIVKMGLRAMCTNQELYIGMRTNCGSQLFDKQCYSDMNRTLFSTVADFNDQQDHANNKPSYCGAMATYVSCLNIQPSGNCTPEMAQFTIDITIASGQFEVCGDQTHTFFTTYGGDLKCSASHVITNIFITFLVVMCVK